MAGMLIFTSSVKKKLQHAPDALVAGLKPQDNA
jgi:hypothetical protein